MKKAIAFVLVFVMAFTLAGCCCCIPMEKCELCGASNADKYLEVGSNTYKVCDDCYSRYNFSFDFSSNDSYNDSDDQDSDDYNNDYDFGHNENYEGSYCWSCGTLIPSNQYYCDDCLGYGTCQVCGKSISEDCLYCNECLGFGTCQNCGKSIDDDRLYCDSCLYN